MMPIPAGIALDCPLLIVFGGRPGTGKSTLAAAIAQERGAMYLRVDTIEQAIRVSGMLADGVGPAGYLVGYAVAEANLRLGRDVVADSVNPLAVTRNAWRAAGEAAGASVIEIEIVCSEKNEHRRRIETRTTDIAGLALPGWDAVEQRDYEAWDRPRWVIDTARRTAAESLDDVRRALDSSMKERR